MSNDSAQVINSDGNNNLKVYVVNESGGGGGGGSGIPPMVAIDTGSYQNISITGGVTDIAALPSQTGTYLLAAHFALSVSGSGLAVAQYEISELVLTDNATRLRIADMSFWFPGGNAPSTPMNQSIEIWYPVPINLTESFASAITNVHMKVFAGSWALNTNVRIITGNPQT